MELQTEDEIQYKWTRKDTIKITVAYVIKLTSATASRFFSRFFIMKTFVSLVFVLLVATLIYAKSGVHENEIDDFVYEKMDQYTTKEAGESAERGRLISYLLDNGYDKRNYPTNMTVKFAISPLNMDIDEKKSTIEADIYIKMIWLDKRLSWDPTEFNIGHLQLAPDNIWHPDITLYNSATIPNMMKCHDANIVIFPTGETLWPPACHLSSYCNLTLATDPYGQQHCHLQFGSWAFDGISMNLQIWKNETSANMDEYQGITQWDWISSTAVLENKYYSCCEEPYPAITYNFTIQRKPDSYTTCSL